MSEGERERGIFILSLVQSEEDMLVQVEEEYIV